MRTLRIAVASTFLLLWLAVAGIGGPTFGKLSQVSSNDQATFLPASAESTIAADWVARFSESDRIPAIVVAALDDELAPEALGALAGLADVLAGVDGVGDVVGPIPSDDAKALQLIVLLDTNKAEASDTVAELRDVLGPDGDPDFREGVLDGAQWHVTGPAGFSADLGSAFAGVDGLLLIVTLSVVLVILVAVYRSVLLPLVVIVTSMSALTASVLSIYWLARAEVIVLNGQSQGILSILVIGATTDYALLLVARHKEELTRTASVFEAMRNAVRGSFGAITASAATVAVALLCLLVSDLNSNRSLGPIAAIGILFAWLSALTLLPAMLYLLGRAAYWPAAPRFVADASPDPAPVDDPRGIWSRVARAVDQRPRAVWVVTLALLLLGAVWLPTLRATGVSTSDLILGDSDAKSGQAVLSAHFDAGSGSPTQIIVPEGIADEALPLIEGAEGVADVTLTARDGSPAGIPPRNEPAHVVDGRVLLQATLSHPADSAEAEEAVVALREALHDLDAGILVGGPSATALDSNLTAERDLTLIIPLVLVVVLAILMVLLRAVLLPVLLILATIVSFGTAMGTAALVFNHVLDFPGADPSVPLYGFVFLVALGIDYTIFLMTRASEETPALGTRRAVLKALTVTGGVITSAGVVLAATFAALAVIPLMFMVQLAFIVAFGVLIDTLIVRTLLVPGLALDVGPAIWWPRRPEPTGQRALVESE